MKRQLQSPYDPKEVKFTHSVASGDPLENSVILWTRASPLQGSSDSVITVSGTAPLYDHDNTKYVEGSDKAVCVEWSVATDDKLRRVVSKGKVWTSYEVDWTVKVRLLLAYY
jgi:alkaline phosphatase D